MAAVTNILYLNGGITTGIGTADTVTAPGTWTFSGTGNTAFAGSGSFAGDLSVTGNLDVSGDIVAHNTVNLTISDPFIDLGLGNSSSNAGTVQAGGFTLQMAAAASVTAATVKRFVTGTQLEINDSGATALVADQIFAITGLPAAFSENEGLYCVDSVSGSNPQVVNIKSAAIPSAPFVQTAFTNTLTTQIDAGYAFQTRLSAFAFANGVNGAFPDINGNSYAAGSLLKAYSDAAVLSDFTANAAWKLASLVGQSIFTPEGGIALSGSNAVLDVSASTSATPLGLFYNMGSGTGVSALNNSSGNPTITAQNFNSNGNAIRVIGNASFKPAATGSVAIEDGRSLRFYEPDADGANYTSFKALAQDANIDYSLPTTAPTNGQYLQSDASGVLSWSTVAADTLQSAYNAGNSITTASATPILFTLADGGFDVESGAVNFGSGALTAVTTFDVAASDAATITSDGNLNLETTGANILIGSTAYNNRIIRVGQGGTDGVVYLGSSSSSKVSTAAKRISINANLGYAMYEGPSIEIKTTAASNGQIDIKGTGAGSVINISGLGSNSNNEANGGVHISTQQGQIRLSTGNSQNQGVVFPQATAVGVDAQAVTATQYYIVSVDYGADPAQDTIPEVHHANAATATDRVFGVATKTLSAESGLIASVPGTLVKVAFTSTPQAGDVGKPVYLSTTDGKAALSAPNGSGQNVIQVGILVSVNGTANAYIQYLPQFIAAIP